MYQYKKFILFFFLISCIVVFTLPVTNLYIDRYRVFNAVINHNYDTYYWRKDGKWEFNHNDRIIPMSFLLNKQHTFDSFIFGNSKIGNMDVRQLGSTWYKLNYNSSNMTEHLHNAKLLLNNINVNNIILTIDLEYFYDLKLSTKYKKCVYPSNKLEWLTFYKKFLLKRLDEKDINLFLNKDYELIKKEEYFMRKKADDNRLFLATTKHLNHMNDLSGLRYKNSTFTKRKTDFVIDMIKQLKLLCEEKDTTLTVIFVPFHYKNIFQADPDKVKYIKQELASITEFIDFSLPHNYILNNIFWREVFHYTKALNDEIIRRLKDENQICPTFGTSITKENIDNKLKKSYLISQKLIPELIKEDTHFFPHDNFMKKIQDSSYLSIDLDKINKNCLEHYKTKDDK